MLVRSTFRLTQINSIHRSVSNCLALWAKPQASVDDIDQDQNVPSDLISLCLDAVCWLNQTSVMKFFAGLDGLYLQSSKDVRFTYLALHSVQHNLDF